MPDTIIDGNFDFQRHVARAKEALDVLQDESLLDMDISIAINLKLTGQTDSHIFADSEVEERIQGVHKVLKYFFEDLESAVVNKNNPS